MSILTGRKKMSFSHLCSSENFLLEFNQICYRDACQVGEKKNKETKKMKFCSLVSWIGWSDLLQIWYVDSLFCTLAFSAIKHECVYQLS